MADLLAVILVVNQSQLGVGAYLLFIYLFIYQGSQLGPGGSLRKTVRLNIEGEVDEQMEAKRLLE